MLKTIVSRKMTADALRERACNLCDAWDNDNHDDVLHSLCALPDGAARVYVTALIALSLGDDDVMHFLSFLEAKIG